MAGERAVGMFTDPPYLVDYDGGNHPQTWKDGKKVSAAAKTKHWDAYTDHDQAVGFYRAFLAAALAEALGERPDHLPVVCRDAHRHRHGRLASQRAALPPDPGLAQESAGAGT